MKVSNFIDFGSDAKTRRINEVWDWVVAIDAFDFNEPDPLHKLLQAEPVPPELQNVIDDIESGARKPNKKAAAKLKIPPVERMKIAGSLSVILGLIDLFKFGEIVDEYGEQNRALDVGANRRMRDPVAELRDLELQARQLIDDTAKELSVSTETVENLLRDFRRKMMNWPHI